jgi:hypothetical protein
LEKFLQARQFNLTRAIKLLADFAGQVGEFTKLEYEFDLGGLGAELVSLSLGAAQVDVIDYFQSILIV